MVRVKRGTTSIKHRRNVLGKAKGYRFGRSTKEREAKVAIAKAGVYAFAHRRDKKNDFRRLWNIKIGAALKTHELSYSKFIGLLREKNIALNRKMLADLAENEPNIFAEIIAKIK
ncbi:MAG: 50S ribosomal protein L20 [Candidatus Paceibacterota bacterium]|jgi:large subunit ribosomal protein L20